MLKEIMPLGQEIESRKMCSKICCVILHEALNKCNVVTVHIHLYLLKRSNYRIQGPFFIVEAASIYVICCIKPKPQETLLCGLHPVQICLSSKYGAALRVFVPTIASFNCCWNGLLPCEQQGSGLLEHILFPTENCFLKRKKVKNVMKLLPPHYFKHLMSMQVK